MADALISLGGNVGDVRATFAAAIPALLRAADATLVARSSDYATPPWGNIDQATFVNACIRIATPRAPHPLLAAMQTVERAFGRDRARERHWGPRPLDLDLIAYDAVVLDSPDLTLPHPRLFERAFVLVPLAEIAPDRAIAGRRVSEALAGVDASGIERLPPL